MHKTKFAVAAGLVLSGCGAAQATTSSDTQQDFVQSLGAALQDFARRTGWQALWKDEEVSGAALTTHRIEEETLPREAPDWFLAGIGLNHEFVDDRAVRLETPSEHSQTLLARADDVRAQSQDRAAAGASSSRSSADADSHRQQAKLEEVVVTAQRREERLQDVPIAISVLRGDDLDSYSDRGVAQALNRVPGVVSAITPGAGRLGNAGGQITVRGVSPTIGGGTVAYYLDTIPFGFIRQIYAPDSSAYDLGRVEVLRGPQGTLYGSSALSGVVRVLTKDANLQKFEFKARGSSASTEDGGMSYRGDMAVNVPIVEDKLAARLVLGYQKLGGWIDKPFGKDANDDDLKNFRLKINAQPTEHLSVGLLAWLSRMDSSAPPISADGRDNTSPFEEPSTTDYDAFGLKVAYDFPFATLTSMTSYMDFDNRSKFDFFPLFGFSRYLKSLFGAKMYSEEVLLSSSGEGPWRWSVGGMYRDVKDRVWQDQIDPATGASAFAAPAGREGLSESYSVFGEVTRRFLDGKLELTGGVRYFEDSAADHELSRFDVGIPPSGLINTAAHYDNVSPRLVMSWHPHQEATVYASYSEGFRSGLNQTASVTAVAPNIPPADPDTLKNYELGAKGSVWDGRLQYDAAAFYLDWRGVQQLTAVEVSPGVAVTAPFNAESASGLGFEIGLTIQPLTDLTLSCNYSWNNLELDRDIVAAGNTVFLAKGTRLGFSPKYTAGASADYAFPLGGGGYRGRISVSANYMAKQKGELGDVDSALMSHASLGLDAPSNWGVALFADNLGNSDPVVPEFVPGWNVHSRPRTIGLQFEYQY
jgi:outer membrane receptor protein involved in Fe transport